LNHIIKLTRIKLKIEFHKIIIFGAGKIGRSFIGQLFGCSGYEVIFIDINPLLIKLINKKGSYRVIIKGNDEKEINVPNVKAISAFDKKKVINAVSTAGIIAISVGKNSLEKALPIIAEGLVQRNKDNPNVPLDIILAENMRGAAEYTRENLKKALPSTFPIDSMVGLIETSIGKMVPIIPSSELEKDPLVVFAEPYNTLILDGKGFKSAIPEIPGLAPKNNIKAWVDRKAFIHNLGHTAAAYYGHYLHPDAVYIYEILEDENVFNFTRSVMVQSADILLAMYPDEFTADDLKDHIEDLLHRFKNKALQDSIFRVGQDLTRKLSADDRFMGAIRLAVKNQLPYATIVEAMSYGFCFMAKDEEGIFFQSDLILIDSLSKNFEATMVNDLHLNPVNDSAIIAELKEINSIRSCK